MKGKGKSTNWSKIAAGFIIFLGMFSIWDEYTSGLGISPFYFIMILGGIIFLLIGWKKSK
ncbi:hypothetical protein [Croceitalea sp. P059]|uniref:hypothetical protein n=1 Tax=Croceitalea sp. P059 TaxID=3075601 RepID=UPI00288583E0|nr:hypothetical protein [Croceitalea sp. P059]MDT0539339.1 hypothetical protein [Croceitalea sp. P059]